MRGHDRQARHRPCFPGGELHERERIVHGSPRRRSVLGPAGEACLRRANPHRDEASKRPPHGLLRPVEQLFDDVGSVSAHAHDLRQHARVEAAGRAVGVRGREDDGGEPVSGQPALETLREFLGDENHVRQHERHAPLTRANDERPHLQRVVLAEGQRARHAIAAAHDGQRRRQPDPGGARVERAGGHEGTLYDGHERLRAPVDEEQQVDDDRREEPARFPMAKRHG